MAKIKLGALISDVRGSLGGMTIQATSSGLVMKNKNMRKRTSGEGNFITKTHFLALSNFWANYSEEQKNKWQYVADNSPYVNIYGRKVQTSGRNYFMAVNMYRLPPFFANTVAINPSGGLLSKAPSVNPEITWDGDNWDIDWNQSFADTNYTFNVAISQPLSSRPSFWSTRLRYCANTLNVGAATNITVSLFNAWGVYPSELDYFWIRLVIFSAVTGQIFSVNKYFLQAPLIP